MRRIGLLIAIVACATLLFPAWVTAQPAADVPAPEKESPEQASTASPEGKANPTSNAAADDGLSTQQRQVAERFRELEKLLLRMAELTAPTDPRRAALLRQAVAQSKERDIDHQFDQLVELLKEQRLSLVVKNQGEVQQDLAKLLELLLSEDRGKRIESEKARIREYLKQVNKIIKEQKAVQGETNRDGDPRKLADRQSDLSDKTGELAKNLAEDAAKSQPASDKQDQQNTPGKDDKKDAEQKDAEDKDGDKKESDQKDGDQKDGDQKDGDKKDGDKKDDGDSKPSDKPKDDKGDGDRKKSDQGDSEGDGKRPPGKPSDGKPSEGQPSKGSESEPPADDSPAQKRLEQAQNRMKEAQEKLEQAKKDEAVEKQAEAIKELEQAKADLEEILRQLREEEMSRMLAMLESRFRKMLDQQVEVYEGTKRLDQVPPDQRDRDDEIESGRLGRKEGQIAAEADKALAVLREEGSAVAFPEAVMEMRDDMEQVVARLAESKVGEVTQGIEQDIIAALEELIASLKKAQKDMESKPQEGKPGEGGDDEQPLVDSLAELKMIRALQMRVNTRTQRYAEMTKTEQTKTPELLDALRRLSEREERIHKVTRDIVVGRNR